MSKGIVFDKQGDLYWHTKANLAHGRAIAYLERHLGGHPAFVPVFANRDVWNSMDAWYFDKISIDGLRKMQRVLGQMMAELPTVLKDINSEEMKFICEQELFRLREVLGMRIEQLEADTKAKPSNS